jgi:hypothetical protein
MSEKSHEADGWMEALRETYHLDKCRGVTAGGCTQRMASVN